MSHCTEEVHREVRRGMFGPKRDKVVGELRKQNSEELCDLYITTNILQEIK